MKKLVAISILLVFSYSLIAQDNNSNIWYFGEFAGIDFNAGSPVARTDGQLNTWEGCASICNKAGELLFYTDGRTVYNKNHEIMSNGTGLTGAYSSSQSSIIVPKPHHSGGNTLYYIFTTDCWENDFNGGFRYSVVDMSLQGGLGAVTSEKNILVHDKVSEKLAAVLHLNGTDVWVMVHDWGTNHYLAYKLTESGLETVPVISAIGVDYEGEYHMGAGQLRFSGSGKYVASSMNYYYRLEIMKFDPSTGILSDLIEFRDNTLFRRVWGIEFSKNEKFLYYSKRPPDILCQLDIQNWDYSSIISSRKVIEATNGSPDEYDAGTLQMAPDDKIYLTRYNKGFLSVIASPDNEGDLCEFKENGVGLGGRIAKWGLPNLLRNYFGADFTWQPDCFGDTTLFTSYLTNVDSVLWNFGDTASGLNNSSGLLNPSHIFTSSGWFTVTLTAWSAGFPHTVSKDILINEQPSVNLGTDTVVCENSSFLLEAGGGYDSYLWQDGSNDSVYQVDASGVYYVMVENECGIASDTIVVGFKESFKIDLGFDTTFCNGNSTILSPGGGYENYLWQDGSTDTLMIAGQAGVYWVKVTDTLGCSATDSLIVRTYPAFEFNLGNDTTICYGDYIFLNGPDGYESYQWQDGSDYISYIADTAGFYWLEVSDTNHCAVRDSLLLTTNLVPDTILGPDTLFCSGGNITLQTNPEYEKYFWQDGSEGHVLVVDEPGKYWVTVFDTLGCSGSDSINLSYFSAVTLELQSAGYLCDDDSVILTAVSNYNNYLWQDSSQSQTCIAKDSGTYWVRVNSPCETKSDTIVIDACSSIWVPNVFTPNNDGYNDYFYAIGKNIPKFKMEIFNRWGQTLKTLYSIDEKWDGTYKGQTMPQGTYFWVADYERIKRDGSTEHVRLQGSVMLMR